MTRLRISSLRRTRPSSWINARKPLNGSTTTPLPPRKISKQSRKSWKPLALQLSRSCTKLVVLQVVCPEVCQTCLVVLPLMPVQDLDQPLKKLIKTTFIQPSHMCYTDPCLLQWTRFKKVLTYQD